MLFQVLCGFEPIFYTTHPNEEPKKEEKELMVEKLKRKGIGVVFQNNTPMFNVKSKDDIKLVEESMRPFGSFGYRY